MKLTSISPGHVEGCIIRSLRNYSEVKRKPMPRQTFFRWLTAIPEAHIAFSLDRMVSEGSLKIVRLEDEDFDLYALASEVRR
jgi:hypothetical protein